MCICLKIVKVVEKSRFRSWSQDFCLIFEGHGFGFGQSGLGKKSLGFGKSGLGNISIGFGFGKIWSWIKVSALVSENLASEKKSRFRKILYRKKVLLSVSVKTLVSSFSADSKIGKAAFALLCIFFNGNLVNINPSSSNGKRWQWKT